MISFALFIVAVLLAVLGQVPAVHLYILHHHSLAFLLHDQRYLIGACPSVADVLRARSEFLGPRMYHRASWRFPWLTLIPRGEYEQGTGFVKSVFTIGRSEPQTDEEAWQQIQALNPTSPGPGDGVLTYNQVYTGELEQTYVPEAIGLRGPVIDQDTLPMYWNSAKFWASYFEAIEKRSVRTIINRMANVYMSYCYKACAGSNFAWQPGFTGGAQIPQYVDLSALINNQGLPNSELTQEFLDQTAVTLNQEGADEGDTNAWIQQDADGPIYPLLIGQEISQRILLNNPELRSDYNQSFEGWAERNPVIFRLGAKRVIKNFRHMIDRFPPRWARMVTGQTIQWSSTGGNSTTNPQFQASCTISAGVATISFTWNGSGSQPSYVPTPATYTLPSSAGSVLVRIPTMAMSSNATDVTKGQAAVVNGCWTDSTVAGYEGCVVLNPLVMTEEILMPMNSLPGAKLNVQNYMGEWDYVTGNDAVLGMDGCTGIADPKKKLGRHFGEYRCAWQPGITQYGRFILFLRCGTGSAELVQCS